MLRDLYLYRGFIRRGVAFVNSRPRLRLRLIMLMGRLGLYGVLKSIYLRYQPNTPFGAQNGDSARNKLQDLTPNARRIYKELKTSLKERQKESS
jgi:hypothetical protein